MTLINTMLIEMNAFIDIIFLLLLMGSTCAINFFFSLFNCCIILTHGESGEPNLRHWKSKLQYPKL